MKSKIEISPKEYWLTHLTYEEAILYCFSLDIDGITCWRLPTREEYNRSNIFPVYSWYQNHGFFNTTNTKMHIIIPVRDLT